MSPVRPSIRLPAADIPVRTAGEVALIRPPGPVACDIESVFCRFGLLVGLLRSGSPGLWLSKVSDGLVDLNG